MKNVFSVFLFLFVLIGSFLIVNDDVLAESGTFVGVLSSAEEGYNITNDQGFSVNINYTTDLSNWVGSEVEMTYVGSLQDSIEITNLSLLNDDTSATGKTHTPVDTYFAGVEWLFLLSGIVFLLGLVLILNGKSYIKSIEKEITPL